MVRAGNISTQRWKMDIVEQPKIWANETLQRLFECGLELIKIIPPTCPLCGRSFYEAISQELELCANGFHKVCKFGDIVGPQCRFAPVDKFKAFQYEQLEVRVKALEAVRQK
jgi:hypothetical protein